MAREQDTQEARAAFKAKVALAAIKGDRTRRRVGERVRGSPEPDLRLEEAAAGRSDERFRRRRRRSGGYGQRSAG
jgi:hypothetical protein